MGWGRTGHFNVCAETINPKGGESDGCSKNTTSHYITRLAVFVFLEGLMLNVCNPVFRCIKV